MGPPTSSQFMTLGQPPLGEEAGGLLEGVEEALNSRPDERAANLDADGKGATRCDGGC
jgi:hypothetical protein